MALACVRSTPENGPSKLESRIHSLRFAPKGPDCRFSPHMLLQDSSSTTSTFTSDGDALSSSKSSVDSSSECTQSNSMLTASAYNSPTASGSLRFMTGSNSDRTHASSLAFYSSRRGLLPESLSLRERLNTLRMNDCLCDVTVLCHDRVFPAHQAILMATSSVCTFLIDEACVKPEERDGQSEVTKLNLPECLLPSEINEDSEYQMLSRISPSGESEISSNPTVSADAISETCSEAIPNPNCSTDESKESRIRAGGVTLKAQESINDCIHLTQKDSNVLAVCNAPSAEQDESTVESKEQNDSEYFSQVKRESSMYVLCSKKELEVTVENKRIRVKTVTSRVACSKSASYTSKPIHVGVGSTQEQDLQKTNTENQHSDPAYPYFQHQVHNQAATQFTPSSRGTDDSGVCVPDYPASEPSSSLPTTSDIGNLPDLDSLLNVGYENVSFASSDTHYDLELGGDSNELHSETTTNDETIVPLRKCNSGTSLSNQTSWDCGTGSEALGPVLRCKKLLLPSQGSTESEIKSVPTTATENNTDRTSATNHSLGPAGSADVTISINSVDPDIFEVLLDFAYTGTYKKLRKLTVERFPEVNSAARTLKMTGLNVLCSQAFRESLTPKNFVSLWNLAERAQSKQLINEVAEYLVLHLDSLWMSPHLLQLPYQRMLRVLLTASSVTEMKPDLVLRTFLAWVKMDPTCRCHTIKGLWPVVSKSTMSQEFVQQLLAKDTFVMNMPELQTELGNIILNTAAPDSPLQSNQAPSVDSSSCSPLIPENLASHRLRSRARSDNELYVSKRLGVRQVMVNLKRDGANTLHKFRFCRPNAPPACAKPVKEKLGPAQVLKMVPTVERRAKPSVHKVVSLTSNWMEETTSCQPPLIVIGKSEPLGEVTVLKLERKNERWTEELIELNVVMEDKQAVHFHDVYVMLVGGEKGYMGRKLRTVFLCDLRTNWMIQLPDMHMGRSGAAIFMVGATMYVAGGKGRYGEDVSEVEALEVNERVLRWKVVPSMKVKRSSHSIVTTKSGYAYVLGGGTNRCERFHPKLKKWTDVPALPAEFARFDPVQVAVKNEVVAMIRHRPHEIFVLNEERLTWSNGHVGGCSPSTIVSATSWDRTIVVVDDKKLVYSCVLGENEWKSVTKISRPHFKSVMIVPLTSKENTKSPTEIKWLRTNAE